ncbi:MAG TPA: CBS domain-containing protein [Gemmatimonadales bacterium]|nr:CBS domain-containing protein [Gemmatimonadales bacterium]
MATLRDLLARKGSRVISIRPDATVLEAALLMNESGIGGLVVLDGGTLAGVVTERDMMRRVIAQRRDPATTEVRAVMTSPVVTCAPGTTVEEAAAVMTNRRIRHLPVQEGGRLVGLITIGDLLAFQVAEQQATIQYMSSYIFDTR